MMALKLIRKFCNKSNVPACVDTFCKKEIVKSEKCIRKVNVSLQGANSRAGFAAALLLKQHPLIKKIYMYDKRLNTCVARDLNVIDSSAKVEAFTGIGLPYSLRAADIVVLIDTDSKEQKIEKKFQTSYLRVKKFAETCTLHCPKAVVIVCVEPVCCMTALVQSILEETPFYNPSRLLGSVSCLQGMMNTTVANNLNLDPTSVHVPLLGGSDVETVVPLISLMTPDPGLSPRDQISFYELTKREITKSMCEMSCRTSMIHEGYAIGKICITVAKGLNGDTDALASVLTRTSQIYPLQYFVSTVRFGVNGIYHNYGIPKLTTFEVQELEKVAILLERRNKFMHTVMKNINKSYLRCGSS